jgi:hypothetical protein
MLREGIEALVKRRCSKLSLRDRKDIRGWWRPGG